MKKIAAFLLVTCLTLVLTSFDTTPGYCNYTSAWYTDPCEPYHGCGKEAAWPFSDKCYEHWGMPEVPMPEGCQ